MHIDDDFCSLLECPQTKGDIENRDGLLYSVKGNFIYNSYDGIPWFFKYPDIQMHQWQQHIKNFLINLELETERIEKILQTDGLLKTTEERLKLHRQANRHNMDAIIEILEAIVAGDEIDKPEHKKFVLDQLPSTQHLNSYLQTIYRDWGWGEEENKQAIDLVKTNLNSSYERVAVLGAGASRLAFDIHQSLVSKSTIAMDINPILLCTANQVVFKQAIELYEATVAPLSLEDCSAKIELKCHSEPKPGFYLMFADAINLPLKPKSMDLIVTPWFIDIVAQDLKNLAKKINHCLKPGGTWLNFGPLGYNNLLSPKSYSTDEIKELIALDDIGFELVKDSTELIDYLVSPHSSHGRKERVFCFSAKKKKDAKEPGYFQYLPNWITDTTQVIPRTQSIEESAIKSRVHNEVLKLIDGKRNQEQVQELMVKEFGMNKAMAQESLASFLINLFEKRI